MSVRHSVSGNTVTVTLAAQFGFRDHKAFMDAFNGRDGNTNFIIDFAKVGHIDSSALGMLLIAKDMAGGNTANITFRNCSEDLVKIFKTTQFHELFNIE